MIPRDLELDTFEGLAFVGMVFRRMASLRALPTESVSFGDFHEMHLRTYVRYRGANPGMWFFSMDSGHELAARIGRSWLKFPYHHAVIEVARHLRSKQVHVRGERVSSSGRGARAEVRYEVGEPLGPSAPGTLEHHLHERYCFFTGQAEHLRVTHVRHAPFELRSAKVLSIEETLSTAAFVAIPPVPPVLAHCVDDAEVDVWLSDALPRDP